MIETLLFSAPANALTFFKFEMFLNSQLERVSGIELLFYAKQTMICQYHTLFKPKKKKKIAGHFCPVTWESSTWQSCKQQSMIILIRQLFKCQLEIWNYKNFTILLAKYIKLCKSWPLCDKRVVTGNKSGIDWTAGQQFQFHKVRTKEILVHSVRLVVADQLDLHNS